MNNKMNNFNITRACYDSLLMSSKDLLLICGNNEISIINVNSYNLIRIIDVSGSGRIYSSCV